MKLSIKEKTGASKEDGKDSVGKAGNERKKVEEDLKKTKSNPYQEDKLKGVYPSFFVFQFHRFLLSQFDSHIFQFLKFG